MSLLRPATFSAFSQELSKLGALTPDEQELLREAIRRQAAFDRQAGQDALNEAGKAAMRRNTERIRVIRDKSRGSAASIPDWAKDFSVPSGASSPPPPRRSAPGRATGFESVVLQHPHLFATGFGALTGALTGAFEDEKELRAAAKRGGPLAQFKADHPVLTGAALRGSALGLATLPVSPLVGALSYALPFAVFHGADKLLKNRVKQRKRA